MKLVKHLNEKGIPIAVATSSHEKAFLLKSSQNQELFSLFKGNILCGDHPLVKRGKPAPDIFLEAARMLGASNVAECLVFEDAPSGVLAGLNAGMSVVWVHDENLQLSDDLRVRAHKVMTNMEHFSEYQCIYFRSCLRTCLEDGMLISNVSIVNHSPRRIRSSIVLIRYGSLYSLLRPKN